MLAIATEIASSVMSFNVGTTLLVQTACPLDNSTDTQAASVYKHYNLMISPYLLLVTGNFWSKKNARPIWGCSIDWTVYIKKMHFKSSSKYRPLFPVCKKLPTDNCRRQFQAQRTRGFRTFPGKLSLGHQQPLSKWYMYAPWIKICENHIFISSKQFGT